MTGPSNEKNRLRDTRALIVACLLQLDVRSGIPREHLHRLLVELALYEASGPLSKEDVEVGVALLLDQEHVLTTEEIDSALASAIGLGEVSQPDDHYHLAEPWRAKLKEVLIKDAQIAENFHQGILESIAVETGERLDVDTGTAIINALDRVLQGAIYERSLHIARGRETIEEGLEDLEAVDVFAELESCLTESLPPHRLLAKTLVKRGIQRYLTSMPEQALQYLQRMHCNVFIHQVLNLDPATQELHRRWCSARRLYLDTNVIVGYLFDQDDHHQAAVEVLNASSKIGAQLFVSPVTIEELQRKVQRAKLNYLKCHQKPLLMRAAPIGNDVILRTYFEKWRQEPRLQWELFIATYEQLPELLIELPAPICLEEEAMEEAANDDRVPQIRKVMREVKPGSAPERIIDHDVSLSSLVYQLRKLHPADERGERVWALTTDTALSKAQRILVGGPEFDSPYCMRLEQWGSIAAPLQNVLGFVFVDFVGYLVQSRLGAFAQPEYVQLELWDLLVDAPFEMDKLLELTPQHMGRVMTVLQKERDAIALRAKLPEQVEAEEVESVARYIQDQLDQVIEETDPLKETIRSLESRLQVQNRRLHHLEREATLKDKRIEQLEQVVRRYEEMSFLERLKALFGF